MPRHNDFYDLLNSNNVPNFSQAASVKQMIDGLSKRISKLQSQLDALEGQRQRHQAILSPVRRIPMEILGEIFALVLPDVLYSGDRRMLRNLGLVCKSWQNASLLARHLWSGLQLIRPPKTGAYGRIVSWLTKSGALPKTLQFDGGFCNCWYDSDFPCLSTNPELLKVLTMGPSLDHFELLNVHLACFLNLIAAINSAKNTRLSGPCPWDTLRSFRLQCACEEGQGWDEAEDISQFTLNHLPLVTSLDIELPTDYAIGIEGIEDDGDHIVKLFIPVKLLNQLTTFAIEYDWDGAEVFSLLENCKNLETLTITFGYRSHFLDEQDPKLPGVSKSRLILPKVRKCRIGRSTRIPILKYLAMPALSNLDIDLEYCHKVDNEFGTILHAFFKASNASKSLQALRISDAELPAADLRHCLSNLPSLKYLTLNGVEFGDRLFDTTGTNQNLVISPHLPSLKHLKLLDLLGSYHYQSDFYCFQRAKRCSPFILSMSYRTLNKPESCDESQIQTLKKAGVLLNLLPSPPTVFF